MDKLNTYIPVPIFIPEIPKKPCLRPECLEKQQIFQNSAFIKKQPQFQLKQENKKQ
jgi:hypothetical protein